ncbi:MAG: HupE/UreJ family protein [Alphaproteobacteria bacterium]
MFRWRPAAAAAIAIMLSGAARAHTGHDEAGSFLAGLFHPVGGIDHVLAMVAVGFLAGRLGGRTIWTLPAAFVAAMSAGALFAFVGGGLAHVEAAIALSVVVLGLMMAADRRWPTVAASLLIAAFGLFHGYAHGAEAPDGGSLAGYGAGFMLSTVALHVAGIAAALVASRVLAAGPLAARIGGAMIAASGLVLLAG